MHVWLDEWIAVCLLPLALWILVSGLDDLFVSAVFALRRRRGPDWPSGTELAAAPKRRIAVLVPLWREQDVIGRMLEHNLSVIRYENYDIFAGVYVNDPPTRLAVQAVAGSHPQVHVAVNPRPGPTSKADCLNHIYRALRDWETSHGVRFEIIVTHDAEDLIHRDSLAAIDHFAQWFDMVQVPVLPLPTPARKLIHGLYCDEFAEYQTKDIPVRQWLGGFIPSNGVGTGFTREVLERIAETRGGNVFEPECLTEDYENGFAVHALGRRQLFLPLARRDGAFAATREYFPSTFRAAVRQRTRWVTGIALQGWQRHGWPARLGQAYWFWRDRKGLVGNLLAPAVNLLFLYGAAGWLAGKWTGAENGWLGGVPEPLAALCAGTLALSVCQLAMRMVCCARVYGISFSLLVPVRVLAGNYLNGVATAMALWRFGTARLRRQRLAWGKTDHQYPEGALLKPHKPLLGEILVRMRCLSPEQLGRAVGDGSRRTRIGEYLVQTGAITERGLYEALSAQSGLPLEDARTVRRAAARLLPAAVSSQLRVLPVRVCSGTIHIGTTDIPDPATEAVVRRFCSLEIHWRLLPPASMEALRAPTSAR